MPFTHLSKSLNSAISNLESKRFKNMRTLADSTMSLAISQNDSQLTEIAVILYSLHKMCSKDSFAKNPNKEEFLAKISEHLKIAKKAADSKNRKLVEKSLSQTLTTIEKADSKLSYYMRNVIDKARIKFASTAYSHGISLSKASELTKADKSNILDYIGATKTHEEYLKPGLYEKVELLLKLKKERKNQPIRVVCDSSTIISLSQSCQLFILRKLSKQGFTFYVSKRVIDEIIRRPSHIKRFALSSLRMKYALSKQYIEEIQEIPKGLQELTIKYDKATNSAIQDKKRNIEIIQDAELEALALSEKIGADFVAIDEFTTRAMVENPKKLMQVISRRRGKHLKHTNNLNFLRDTYHIPLIRSSDLIALSFLLTLLTDNEQKTLEASLYGVKYAGCAVATKEIDDFLISYKNLKL